MARGGRGHSLAMDAPDAHSTEPNEPRGQASTPKELARQAIETNKILQQLLTKYAERLEQELKEGERLLATADTDDSQDDFESEVQVLGAKRAAAPFPPGELLNPDSPFYGDALSRSRYINFTVTHPMKAKELEALADAVKRENQRLNAYKSRTLNDMEIDLGDNTEGINWNSITEKVSNSSKIKRTPDECRIRWLGDKHPKLNHERWEANELDRLSELVQTKLRLSEKVNWVDIAKQLGTNRTPIDCMRRGVLRQRHVWTPEYDARLIEAVNKVGTDCWNIVARQVSEHATAGQCQSRYFKTLDPSIKRGAWSEEEDARLRKAVETYGNSWMDIAAVIPGRTNDQCRDRWTENLNKSSSKNQWTDEDDQLLLESVKLMGKQWKAISLKFASPRSGPSCRQRYEKLEKTEMQDRTENSETPIPDMMLPQQAEEGPSQPKRRRSRKTTSSQAANPQDPIAKKPIRRKLPTEVDDGKIPPETPDNSVTTSPDIAVQEPASEVRNSVIPDQGSVSQTEQHTKPKPRPRPIGKWKGKDKEPGIFQAVTPTIVQESSRMTRQSSKRLAVETTENPTPSTKKQKTMKS